MSDSTASGGAAKVIEELSEEECRRLLASSVVGRLGVVDGTQPVIFPVNYAFSDDGIVVHTDPGLMLDAGAQRHVAFEIDEIDPVAKTGWSVLVRGNAFDVTETLDDRSERMRSVELETWAPGDRARRLMITITGVSGRRIRAAGEET